MALGDSYVTVSELKSYKALGQSNTTFDDLLESAVQSASAEIEQYCNRQFNQDLVASARVYTPLVSRRLVVDDFWTTDGLIVEVDENRNGSFSRVLLSSEYELLPRNGVRNGQPGWPYNTIIGMDYSFPMDVRARVRVTAKWGWSAVPDTVKQACLIIASETFQLKDAPFGVAGNNQFGEIRVRDNPMARNKLKAFVNRRLMVG